MMRRKRNIRLEFYVTQEEKDAIEARMRLYGTENLSAFLRKIAIDGYVLKLDLPELKELLTLMRYAGNNINQIAYRANSTGRLYQADIDEIKQKQEKLLETAGNILRSLSRL